MNVIFEDWNLFLLLNIDVKKSKIVCIIKLMILLNVDFV